MLSVLVSEVERWIAGVLPVSWWHEVELDPVDFALIEHPVLPLPGRDVGTSPGWFDMEAFVDGRTGIVNRLDRLQVHPSIPSSLHIVQSVACDMTRISTCANGRSNHGSSFVDEGVARAAAIAECIERYCGNWVDPRRLTEASYLELAAHGEHAVDPERLILHSPAQYAAAGFPLVPFTRDLRVHWVRGECLTCERPAWIPASLVHVNWYAGEHADDPPTNYAMFSGIAAGSSWDAALAAGLEEVIERDATMIWWLNAHRLPGVRPTPRLEAVFAGRPAELGQRAWLIHLDNEFDVPVMAGVVENIDERLLTIGFAARPDPAEAALKAWAEALALQESSRWMQDAGGPFWTAGELVDLASLAPPREDRRYLDTYRADFHDVHTLMAQLQVHLDPRARELIRPWVDVDPVRPLRSIAGLPDRSAATYRSRLERRGFEVFAVDLTTADVATTNVRVARVVVPGLVPTSRRRSRRSGAGGSGTPRSPSAGAAGRSRRGSSPSSPCPMHSRAAEANGRSTPLVLGLGGSTRPGSRALEALRVALDGAAAAGAETRLLGLRDLALPVLDAGCPNWEHEGVRTLLVAVRRADALILSSPVYQDTVGGALKNALDHLWAPEHDDLRMLAGRVIGRVSVAGGLPVAGASAVLRTACRALGAWVLPESVDLGGSSFDDGDAVCDVLARDRLLELGRRAAAAAAARRRQDAVGSAADALVAR